MKTLSAILLLLSFNAFALSYKLDNPEKYSQKEKETAELIFEASSTLFPPTDLPENISVSFSGEEKSIVMSCGSTPNATKFFGQTTNILGKKHITINRAFLQYSPSERIDYPCKHKNFFKEAVATLVHETGHVFDSLKGASNTRVFRNDVYFMKNKLSERSPDAYEFSSYVESFAVNLEYFLMDPEFKCRRPTLNKYYEEVFSHKPFEDRICRSSTYAKLATSADYVDLNPDRLYQIDYFLAGAGKAVMSRFGHSMIRLVFCKPGSPVGPACLKDLSYHVVLSYRANTGNSGTSYVAGLTGGFPSQVFVIPFSKVVDEYNRDEFRNLTAYPIRFTKKQRNQFLQRTLEAHWSYSGKYFFTHNNCATETKQLISSVLEESHPFRKTKSPIPTDLRDDLFDTGLIDDPKVSKEFFPSVYKKDLGIALEKVSPSVTRRIEDLDDYLEKTTAFERAEWFAQVTDRKTKMSFFMLEQNIAKRMNQKIGDRINGLHGKKSLAAIDKKGMDDFLKLQSQTAPWKSLDSSPYGIPSESEINLELSAKSFNDYNQGNFELLKILGKYEPELFADYEQTQKNIKKFFSL